MLRPGCFLHVPKSGGSTVVAALRASLNGGVFHTHERAHRSVPLEYLLSRYTVVAGHFTFAELSPAVLRNAFLFTVLREPVDRAVSLYDFYRAQTAASECDPHVSVAKALDLATFVDQLPERVGPWCNWQTFVLSGARDCEQPARELLPAAMDNLRRMTLVGVSNDLDAMIRRVGELCRWPLSPPFARVNVTPGRVGLDRIDPAVTRRLAELNDCDRQLFACAQALWDRTKATRSQALPLPAGGASAPLQPRTSEHGTQEIVISSVCVAGPQTGRPDEICVGDAFDIRVRGHSHLAARDVTIGIRIDDHLGIEVYGVNTRLLDLGIALAPDQAFEVTFSLKANLAPGTYHVTVAVHSGADHLHRCYHWIDNATRFECRVRSPRLFSGTSDLDATAIFAGRGPMK